MATHLILLAAGEGTRMQSDRPKVLHEIAGAPLLAHALASSDALADGKRVVVVGHGGDQVRAAAEARGQDVLIAHQTEQLGTGHAALQAAPHLKDEDGDTFVLFGDTPFVRPQTLEAMAQARVEGADIVVLGFEISDPTQRYGRLITEGDALSEIVEFKDATEDQRTVLLCNSGVLMADNATLLKLLAAIKNDNAASEYYLTDVIRLGVAQGLSAKVVTCDEAETLGINSRAELAEAEGIFQARARTDALENGVTLQSPETVIFSYDTHLGRDAYVEPNVVFGPGVTVESGARIRAFSHLEGAHVGSGAIVGPYARLRPGTELSNDVKIGNFVETKNAIIADGAKVNHLSYIGNADVGTDTNIGAGTITCNYDGVFKHQTTIGARAFIGSNTMLIAPVTIGDEAMTASGSVISNNVPGGDLAVARSPQLNKPGLARKLFDKLRAAKARGTKG